MDVAAKNQQKELVDVNNLWHWPTEYATLRDFNPNSHFVPEIWKWVGQVAANGYIDHYNDRKPVGIFTQNSMTTKNNGGYSLGVFIDLQPGTYNFSCDSAPLESAIWVMEYQLLPDGTYVYSRLQKTTRFTNHCEMTFQVPSNDIVLCLKMGPNANTSEYTTFTNIKIKETVF